MTTIQLRRGTTAQWAAANPILKDGELGLETDSKKFKVGDGSTTWNSLAYYVTGTTTDEYHEYANVAAFPGTGVADRLYVDISTTPASLYRWTGSAYAAVGSSGGGGAVSSVNTRTGAVTLAKADVGLSAVDNTADSAKPVSTLQAAAITSAVTALVGGAPGALDTLKELADAINDDASYAGTVTTALGLKAPIASPTFTGTVAGITKAMVGLGNSDNVSDVNKPVSTAQATAIGLKADQTALNTTNTNVSTNTASIAAQPAATATAVNTQAVTEVPQLLKPTVPLPTRFPVGSKMLTAFQSGHGWTLGAGTGTVTDDTTVFTEGSQSVALTTTGTNNAATFAVSPALSPTLDLTKNSLVVKLRVDQWARLGGIYFFVSNDASAGMSTTRAQTLVASGISLIAADGEFFWVSVNGADFATSGGFSAVNMTAVTRVCVMGQQLSNGVLTTNVQQVWTRPAPTTASTTIAFDDGYLSQYVSAKPYMDKYGFRGVAYPIRDLITGSATYMSVAQLQALYDSGWDISAHANTGAAHNSTNALLDSSISDGTASALSSFETELALNKTWLLANGWNRSADFFAWPQGKFDAARLAIARKYYALIRLYSPALTSSVGPDTYPWVDGGRLRQIAVQSGGSPTAAATVTAALTAAWAAGKTVILTFHGLGSVQNYEYPVASFQTIIDFIAASGYPVKTLSAIMRDNGIDTPVANSQLTAGLATKLTVPSGFPDGTKVFAGDGTLVTPAAAALPTQTSHGGQFLTTDGTTPSWAPTSSAGVSAQYFTSSGTYTAPATGLYRFSAWGGGGSGGSGGAAALTSGVATQAAGAGGGSGEFVETVVALTAGDTRTVTVGTGGAASTGGTASTDATGRAGTGGATGVSTTIGSDLTARGGSPGGNGGANTVSVPNPGFYGSGGTTIYAGQAGGGGSTSTSSGFQGGAGVGMAAKGGSGGVPATSTLGGFGGTGGFSTSHTGTTTGGNATAVTGNAGAGGNGGGGGAPGGAGGNGGAGAPGAALIARIN